MGRVTLTKPVEIMLTHEEKTLARRLAAAVGHNGMSSLIRGEIAIALRAMRERLAGPLDTRQATIDQLTRTKLPARVRRAAVTDDPREDKVMVPMTEEQRDAAHELAKYVGMSLSALVRFLLAKVAREVEGPPRREPPAQLQLREAPASMQRTFDELVDETAEADASPEREA